MEQSKRDTYEGDIAMPGWSNELSGSIGETLTPDMAPQEGSMQQKPLEKPAVTHCPPSDEIYTGF